MNLGIEKIELEFENCESLTIPAWWIADFCLSDLETQISRFACNCIQKFTFVNSVLIEIGKGFDGPFEGWGGSEISKLERISKYNDITHVTVFYERKYVDEPENFETFAVNYKEAHEGALGSPNLYQKCSYDHLGNILITIGDDPELLLNHDEYVNRKDTDFAYEMYDIGIPFEPAHKLKKADGTFDYPEDEQVVYLENDNDYPDHKGNYGYRKDGEWKIIPSKYSEDKDKEIKPDEIYSWAIHRTCSKKYQEEDDIKIEGLALMETGNKETKE